MFCYLEHYGTPKLVEEEELPPLVDANVCRTEFQQFCHLVKDNYQALDFQDLGFVIQGKYSEEFPNLVKLVQIALLLPVSSADCEHGFSTQSKD